MPKNIYEITYLVTTDGDGLVYHTLKSIKEITDLPEEDDDNENEISGT